MKGSAVTGPVAKECADLWPRIAGMLSDSIDLFMIIDFSLFVVVGAAGSIL